MQTGHTCYQWITRNVPVIGASVRIANAYAKRGRADFYSHVAPWRSWRTRLGLGVLAALVLAGGLSLIAGGGRRSGVPVPHELALSILPDLLGFGIGVFALVFVLPGPFLKRLAESRQRRGWGAEILPADMGYPLVVMALALVVSVFIGAAPPGPATYFVGAFVLFYALVVTVELVSTIFTSAVAIIGVVEAEGDDTAS